MWSDFSEYIFRRPARQTLICFKTSAEREDLSQRILQRIDVGVEEYSVLNLHKIGINVPGRFVFDELMTWNDDSPYWPNRLARVKRISENLDQVDIYFMGLQRLFNFRFLGASGIDLPPLFQLTKLSSNMHPRPRIWITPDPSCIPAAEDIRLVFFPCMSGHP